MCPAHCADATTMNTKVASTTTPAKAQINTSSFESNSEVGNAIAIDSVGTASADLGVELLSKSLGVAAETVDEVSVVVCPHLSPGVR